MMVGRRLLVALRLASLEIKLDALARTLERRYRPDQPRAPRGSPIGGQWVQDPATSPQRTRTALAGELIKRRLMVTDDDTYWLCMYQDMLKRRYIYAFNAGDACPRFYQAPPIPRVNPSP
jgi:hypothetical protein